MPWGKGTRPCALRCMPSTSAEYARMKRRNCRVPVHLRAKLRVKDPDARRHPRMHLACGAASPGARNASTTLCPKKTPQAVKPSCAAPCCSCMLRALRRRQQQPEPKPYPMGSSAGRALGCRMRARRTSRGSRPAAAPRRPPCGTCQRRGRTCAAHGRAEHAGMGPAGRTCDSGVRPAQPAQALRAGQTQRHLETAWRMQGCRMLPCTPAHEQRRRADAARRRLVGQ